jgi:uncharacterized protein (TIGR02284 family)
MELSMTSYTSSNGTAGTTAASATDVIDVLNDLIENSRDGEYGFRACAEEVDSDSLKKVFSDRAAACAKGAQELAQIVTRLGGKADDGGTVTGAMHRGWVHVKGTLGGDSALSMLEECERGEDAAVARFRKALKADLPADIRAVIEGQAEGAQRNHDQIKALRDQMRAKSS